MLVCARTCVDNGNAEMARGEEIVHQICTAFGEIWNLRAHDDNIEVRTEHANGIKNRLALNLRRDGRIPDLVDAHSQDLARGGEGEEGARGYLCKVEHRASMREKSPECIRPLLGRG